MDMGSKHGYPSPIRSAALSQTEFINDYVNERRLDLITKDLRSVTVDRMELVYYAKPGPAKQDYLLPVYVFEGTLQIGDAGESSPKKFIYYVDALKASSPYASISNPPNPQTSYQKIERPELNTEIE